MVQLSAQHLQRGDTVSCERVSVKIAPLWIARLTFTDTQDRGIDMRRSAFECSDSVPEQPVSHKQLSDLRNDALRD